MKLNNKNKLLIFGFFIFLIICYSFGFSKTIQFYRKYKTESELLNSSAGNQELLGKLIKKQKQLNYVLEQNDFKGEASFQNELLKNLNNSIEESSNVKIIDFKEEHIYPEKEVTTISYCFTLEGPFNSILKTIHDIEKKPYLGTVKHININKNTNYSNNTFYLEVDVILQRSIEEKKVN